MDKQIKKSSKPRINDLKLSVLLEITKAINSNLSTEELLIKFENFLRNQLNIEKLALYTNEPEWKCIWNYGFNEEIDVINVAEDLLPLKEITSVVTSNNPHFKPFDLVVPVFHKSQPLAYLLIGDIFEAEIALSPTIKHLPFIQTLTNIIIVAIENKRLAKEKIQQEGIKKELELASQMQALLFPSQLPTDEKLDIAAFYLPHQEVGGDYYDFIRLNDNEVVFCMADVSGKGVSAALLMSNFQANLRALFNRPVSLTEVIMELNNKVMSNAKGEKFITLFIARYNLLTRKLNYINAGHNPPLLTSGDTINFLETGCTGLGMFDELPAVKEGMAIIETNSILICYTDGVVELENETNEDFGTDKLKTILKENRQKSMQDLNNAISEKLISHKGSMPYFDDIALLSCRMY